MKISALSGIPLAFWVFVPHPWKNRVPWGGLVEIGMFFKEAIYVHPQKINMLTLKKGPFQKGKIMGNFILQKINFQREKTSHFERPKNWWFSIVDGSAFPTGGYFQGSCYVFFFPGVISHGHSLYILNAPPLFPPKRQDDLLLYARWDRLPYRNLHLLRLKIVGWKGKLESTNSCVWIVPSKPLACDSRMSHWHWQVAFGTSNIVPSCIS